MQFERYRAGSCTTGCSTLRSWIRIRRVAACHDRETPGTSSDAAGTRAAPALCYRGICITARRHPHRAAVGSIWPATCAAAFGVRPGNARIRRWCMASSAGSPISGTKRDADSPAAGDRANQLLVAASPSDEVSDTHRLRSDVDHFLVNEAIALGVDYQDLVTLERVDWQPNGDPMLLVGAREDRCSVSVRSLHRGRIRSAWIFSAGRSASTIAALTGIPRRRRSSPLHRRGKVRGNARLRSDSDHLDLVLLRARGSSQ